MNNIKVSVTKKLIIPTNLIMLIVDPPHFSVLSVSKIRENFLHTERHPRFHGNHLTRTVDPEKETPVQRTETRSPLDSRDPCPQREEREKQIRP